MTPKPGWIRGGPLAPGAPQNPLLCQKTVGNAIMAILQCCNRIVQYSVQPNNIRRIVDIRLPTEYQYSVFG